MLILRGDSLVYIAFRLCSIFLYVCVFELTYFKQQSINVHFLEVKQLNKVKNN